MSTKGVVFLLAAWLLLCCEVPTMPALAAKTPVGGRGSRHLKVRLISRLDDLKHCKDKTHSLIVKNISNHLEKDGAEYFDVDFDLLAPARRLVGLKSIVHRCPVGVGGKCEYFKTYSWNMPVCALLEANGMMWTPFVQRIQPRWACPLHKGSYVGRNITLDVAAIGSIIDTLDIDKYTWPSEVQIYSENGLYVCYTFVMQTKRVRAKVN